jgi:putative ABC transport system substrate-binding protein
MSKNVCRFALGAMLLAVCFPAAAQQPTKIPWIGYLAGAGSGPAPAFLQGLRDLGYVEGKNIGIVYRTTESRSERSADLAAEVVRLKVDVIVVDGSSIAVAVKKATSSIPIVLASSTDPVGTGLSPAWPDPVETSQA